MSLDIDIFHALNQAGTNYFLDILFLAFTFLGFTYVIIWVPVVAWLVNRKELAIDLAVALLFSSVTVSILKLIVDRDRPFVVLDDVNLLSYGWISSASGPSFPSGHAAKAFAIASVIALNSGRSHAMAAVIVATMVGLSRIYLGLHWPSDVLAGALLGAGIGMAIYLSGLRSQPYRNFRLRVIQLFASAREKSKKSGNVASDKHASYAWMEQGPAPWRVHKPFLCLVPSQVI